MKLPKNNGNSELINCNGINHDIEVCQLNDEEKKLAGKWNYIESRDEMRDKVILGAILTSDNYIDLDSPYGKTKLKLNVVKHDNNYKLMISTDENPSFDCFRDCKIDVKFDNNKVESFSVNIGRDRNVLFVVKAESFIKKMKSSEKLIVEVDIFRNGSNQYKFSPNLLKDF